jgi:hypothetical protein
MDCSIGTIKYGTEGILPSETGSVVLAGGRIVAHILSSSLLAEALARDIRKHRFRTAKRYITMTPRKPGVYPRAFEAVMDSAHTERNFRSLDAFRIELPSWGFANTGTRFGKFLQAAAATTIEEKISDAAQVHSLTGVCPSLALHVQWDFPEGLASVGNVKAACELHSISPGAINPNLFQEQIYKHGSFANPDPAVREQARLHVLDSIAIALELNSRDLSLWFRWIELSWDGQHPPAQAVV